MLTDSVNRLRFSRVLAVVLSANIACLVALNATGAPALLLLYSGAIAGAARDRTAPESAGLATRCRPW